MAIIGDGPLIVFFTFIPDTLATDICATGALERSLSIMKTFSDNEDILCNGCLVLGNLAIVGLYTMTECKWFQSLIELVESINMFKLLWPSIPVMCLWHTGTFPPAVMHPELPPFCLFLCGKRRRMLLKCIVKTWPSWPTCMLFFCF